MIYPIIQFNPETETIISLIDTELESPDDDQEIMRLGFPDGTETVVQAFLVLLQGFLYQYMNGYDDGYEDCLGDMNDEEDEDIDWGDIGLR